MITKDHCGEQNSRTFTPRKKTVNDKYEKSK
jgi:hypothetical protein